MDIKFLRRWKASKKGFEIESGVGNTIFFRMVRKETLWPWNRGIIWSEIFWKDHTGYCVRTRLLENHFQDHCKKYCIVWYRIQVVAVKVARNDKFWIYHKGRAWIIWLQVRYFCARKTEKYQEQYIQLFGKYDL